MRPTDWVLVGVGVYVAWRVLRLVMPSDAWNPRTRRKEIDQLLHDADRDALRERLRDRLAKR